MTTLIRTQPTLEEFLALPETKPAQEYINGRILEKPMPQGKHSVLQESLLVFINQLAKTTKLAYAFPELRCTFGGRSLVPDIAVFSWERIPRDQEGEVANMVTSAPDWVIEILSPEQSLTRMINKVVFCIEQGAQLGWIIDPTERVVLVLQPRQLPLAKEGVELLPVLAELEALKLTVDELFSWLKV
jgi:Uma2 family endonuclease